MHFHQIINLFKKTKLILCGFVSCLCLEARGEHLQCHKCRNVIYVNINQTIGVPMISDYIFNAKTKINRISKGRATFSFVSKPPL